MAGPRKRDPGAPRVLRVVLARLGLDESNKRAIAQALEMDPWGTPQSQIKKWLDGMEPGFPNTMQMLSAAGLLQPEAEAAWRGIPIDRARELVAEARGRSLKLEGFDGLRRELEAAQERVVQLTELLREDFAREVEQQPVPEPVKAPRSRARRQ